MNVQLTVVQLWALVAGGPVAMVLTVLVGILVNNATTSAKVVGIEGGLTGEMKGMAGEMKGLAGEMKGLGADIKALAAKVDSVEKSLASELRRVEGVLGAKIDTLTSRVKALEDEVHSPLVKN